MKNRYRNPWADMCNTPRPEFYENDAPKFAEHRGVEVFRKWNNAFDFVIAGCCITQRAGASEYAKAIDDLLDGESPCADTVADHLRSLGFSPMSYEEYTQKWLKGEVA